MNCPTCSTLLAKEFDRYRCHICGYSKWHHFEIRHSGISDRATGTPIGLRGNFGKDLA